MIKFKDIVIKFGDFTAIKGLNLEVQKGEFFTFLGPSGCGKTTTLRALAGFTKPAGGVIEVNGEDITYKPIEKRGIGMVFQNYALFPTMTVRKNITFGLKENKWKKEDIDERVKDVAKMVNLTEEQLDKNISDLSGGQQQRVAIARALALKPDIIVLDEPLSNLDAKLRKSLRVELKKIQKVSGTTMIYVTHDQEEALTLSDRIAVFNNGYIEQVGTPREIYYHPKSEFVANFIGDSNHLSKKLLESINTQNPGAKLDTGANVYLRVENIKDHLLNEDSRGYYKINAKFILEEFYGITIRKTYLADGCEIKCVAAQGNEIQRIEKSVMLYFKPEDLIVFKEGAS